MGMETGTRPVNDEPDFLEHLAATLEKVSAYVDDGNKRSAILGNHIAEFRQASSTLDSLKYDLGQYVKKSDAILGATSSLANELTTRTSIERGSREAFNTAAEKALLAAKSIEATTGKQARISILWCSTAVLVLCALVGGIGFNKGEESGLAIGQATAHAKGFEEGRNQGFGEGVSQGKKLADKMAVAASWANTPNGSRAYQLDQNGDLNPILECSKPGWKRETQKDGTVMCWPWAENYGKENALQDGWALP